MSLSYSKLLYIDVYDCRPDCHVPIPGIVDLSHRSTTSKSSTFDVHAIRYNDTNFHHWRISKGKHARLLLLQIWILTPSLLEPPLPVKPLSLPKPPLPRCHFQFHRVLPPCTISKTLPTPHLLNSHSSAVDTGVFLLPPDLRSFFFPFHRLFHCVSTRLPRKKTPSDRKKPR